MLCENVRFNAGEKANDEALAKTMASLCDIFVMDAFGTAHRAQASTEGVIQFAPAAEVLNDPSYGAKQRLLNFYQFRTDTLINHLQCKMGCLGCNLSSEMSEHSEKIRLAVLSKGRVVKQQIIAVALEAQKDGDIDADIDIKDLIEFMEDAGKGVMISMKEMKDSYPIDNFMRMVKKLL